MPPTGPATPLLYPLRYRDGSAEVLTLDEAGYRAASFLDERLLQGGAPLSAARWADLLDGAPEPARSGFIFHIGHVGSTLLSRLVGEHPGLFALREPALLRAPLLGQPAPPIAEMARVLARVWRPDQRAVVKATSFVSELGPELMAAAGEDSAAVLLAVTPPVYLRTILAGAASPQEARQLAPLRQARLERRLGRSLSAGAIGELLAMSWLCEVLSLADIAAAAPGRCLWLDFERMLAEPDAALALVLRRFEAAMDPAGIAALVRGPLMTRYAKAPEHGYDATLRRAVLEQAGREQAGELRAGMDWLARLAREHEAVRTALERSAAMSRKLDAVAPA